MKTEVYSWRVSADLKEALEDEARRENLSLAKLLDKMSRRWLKDHRAQRLDDEAEQARLHAAAAKFLGAIRGDNPHRAASVRELVRERLAQKYDR